jgi:hypothetical protein
MYKFRPATDCIRFMHQRIRDRVIQTDADMHDIELVSLGEQN